MTPAPSTVLVARDCPICGTGDASTLWAEATVDPARLDAFAFASRKLPEYMHHRLLLCGRCDLLYASPAPTAAAVAVAYDEAAYDSQVEAGFASRTYAALLPDVVAQLPDRVGALDVGAGDGAFCAALLEAGFREVTGVEPSAAPIAAAPPAIRPLLRHDVFRPEAYAPASLSLVTCFQTIEHLHEPRAACSTFHRVLKPGGALLLVGHDRRALSARLLGRRSPIFDVEHLQLFSQESVRRLLAASGFERIRVWRIANRYPLAYWLKLFPLPDGIKARGLTLVRASRLGALVLPLPAGNFAAVGFRRSA